MKRGIALRRKETENTRREYSRTRL